MQNLTYNLNVFFSRIEHDFIHFSFLEYDFKDTCKEIF